MPIILPPQASLHIEIKTHNLENGARQTCLGQQCIFAVVGVENIRLIATQIATIRPRYPDIIDLGAEASIKSQHKFHYHFKYNIDCPPDHQVEYHEEFLHILSTIPMHSDIVTVQWENKGSSLYSNESKLGRAEISSSMGQILGLLATGTRLFNAGNFDLRREDSDAAMFKFRQALATIVRALIFYPSNGANIRKGLLDFQDTIQRNLIVCCVKRAGATSILTREADSFYLGRIEYYHQRFDTLSGIDKGPMTWLVAILEILTRRCGPRITQKLQICIRNRLLPEETIKKFLFLGHTINRVISEGLIPSTQQCTASVDGIMVPDFSYEQSRMRMDAPRLAGEYYLLKELGSREVEGYRRNFQCLGLTDEFPATEFETADYDTAAEKYNVFLQKAKKETNRLCECEPVTIASSDSIKVAMICKPGICKRLLCPQVRKSAEDSERRNLPFYRLQIRFKDSFSVGSPRPTCI
ncbi:hypothetical protein TWF788_008255 [Orbilia oligospora]|uniref:Uncharacterized protein n=1 Tax=Orbilia oligospora TaxID=2813651 RepID=A0A7C8Q2V7_ORBOL|nr:hypothetical protein TWF788_008255 [Orbilia oligospora]